MWKGQYIVVGDYKLQQFNLQVKQEIKIPVNLVKTKLLRCWTEHKHWQQHLEATKLAYVIRKLMTAGNQV